MKFSRIKARRVPAIHSVRETPVMKVEKAASVEAHFEMSPSYRVNFWTAQPPGWSPQLEAWVIHDVVDVGEVLAWADSVSRGREMEVFLEWPSESDPSGTVTFGRVRLRGKNPNLAPKPPSPHRLRMTQDDPG